ncbi:hypothetical protein SCUCBS95973_000990 [Sporothrix curviconia]|uniref:Zn(2)-C6 fungal-type domain-containing protein n=1 Tax=Sporothrix curviconia TaxID=1260050 RepID=A0ABP0AV61_9PEZI
MDQRGQSLPITPPTRRTTRTERSCDTCRRRKLKCVRETDQERCVLCIFHQRECTYLDEPRQRRKRRRKDDITTAKTAETAAVPLRVEEDGADELMPPDDPGYERLHLTLGLHPTTHFKYIGPGSLHEDMLLDFIDPAYRYHNDQDASKFCRVAKGVTFLARLDALVDGASSSRDSCRADAEEVERLVEPHGPGLVEIYFRIVHPSYPILHKGVFLERYHRSDRTLFLPAPLLAAVYLLAMDWWEYDPALAGPGPGAAGDPNNRSNTKPDIEALAQLAAQSLTTAIHQPKLSTVQACLLLLQRSATSMADAKHIGARGAFTSSGAGGCGGDVWILTSQLVAVAEELGLHVDCTKWNIPGWEKGLRKRLAWATLMQDKWSSLIYGRPSHVQASHWRIPQLSLDDFVEEADGDGSNRGSLADDRVEVEKGQLLFIHLARLTEVMAEALATFYSHDPVRYAAFSAADGMHTIESVKTVALRLRAWATALPSCLRMEAVRPRKLCSNGFLHLSYFVTEIMVYRCIVRSLARKPPHPFDADESIPPLGESPHQHAAALVTLCREAAKTRLLHVMRFVEALRPEHLQAFWWFASAKSLAYIRTYVSILWATSQGADEAEYYRQKLDEFRWSLRIRARGVPFVTAALRDMGDSLEDIDMSEPPFARRMMAAAARRSVSAQSRSPQFAAGDDTGTGSAPQDGRSHDFAPATGSSSGVETDGDIGEEAATAVMDAAPATHLDTVPEIFSSGTPLGVDLLDSELSNDLGGMVFQTTPEFLADFGVAASEAFFADINSLYPYPL